MAELSQPSIPRDPAAGARPRILIVEDDAGVRRSMQLLLQGQGFDVRAYAAGVALLADERRASAACLVADYRLGDGDGLSILAALRGQGWTGPAILITAFASPALRRSAHDAGFAEIIEKPFKDHALVNAVARVTRQRPDGTG